MHPGRKGDNRLNVCDTGVFPEFPGTQMRYTPVSAAPFRALTTLDQLDAAVAASFERPVVLFKHSFSCGVSAEAHEELSALLETGVAGEWHLVDVRTDRALSMAIAERFKVRHESPQVLLIVAGQVRWSGSHYRVTGAAIQAALAEFAAA